MTDLVRLGLALVGFAGRGVVWRWWTNHPLSAQMPIDGFRRDALAVPTPQQGPEPPVPRRDGGRLRARQRGVSRLSADCVSRDDPR